MPPATLSLRRRLAAALPLLVAAAFLFILSLTASSDDYREAAVSTHSNHPAQPHTQQWTTTGGGDRIDVLSGASERVEVEGKGRKARVGLAGAKQKVIVTKNDEGDELSFTVQHEQQPRVRLPLATKNRFSLTAHSHDRFYPRLRHTAERVVTYIGDFLLDLIGFDAGEEWFTPGDEEAAEGLEGGAGAALAGWSESSVYVERTNALYPSRPSSFGPHLVSSPLRGFLFPITSLVPSSDSYACSSTSPTTIPTKKGDVPEDWIALVQRGKCPFSDKVRVAQEWGAKGVVFGDMEESEGGIGGGKALLTPWSPDDTADIQIPSLFVSRASYLSLLRAWQDEQELAQHQNGTLPRSQPKTEDGETQTDLVREDNEGKEKPLVGLEVVLSKEEVFAWPLLDLLFLLLFLPSLLTLVTVFTQRVRVARAAKAERAPKEAVARLPVFRWGDTEKGAAGSPAERADEERDVGSHAVSEGTPLLPHPDDGDASHPTPLAPSLLQRALAYLPTSLTRHLPTRFAPLPPASTAYPRIFSRPSRRFPTLVECPFCLSDFERGDLVMELPCGHVFHEEEVVGWLEGQRGVCPVCRMSVVSQPSTSSESTDSSSTVAADPASSATPVAPPQPINADGAAILVNYLRPPYHSTSSAAPFEPPVQRTYAASPVASSSSVPIEGVLGQGREREEGEVAPSLTPPRFTKLLFLFSISPLSSLSFDLQL